MKTFCGTLKFFCNCTAARLGEVLVPAATASLEAAEFPDLSLEETQYYYWLSIWKLLRRAHNSYLDHLTRSVPNKSRQNGRHAHACPLNYLGKTSCCSFRSPAATLQEEQDAWKGSHQRSPSCGSSYRQLQSNSFPAIPTLSGNDGGMAQRRNL
jgi:hypothetical protein